MARYSYLSHLDCARCGERHDATIHQGLCSKCRAPLLARYDLQAWRLMCHATPSRASHGNCAVPRVAAELCREQPSSCHPSPHVQYRQPAESDESVEVATLRHTSRAAQPAVEVDD
jgi:ribosomal protein L37E